MCLSWHVQAILLGLLAIYRRYLHCLFFGDFVIVVLLLLLSAKVLGCCLHLLHCEVHSNAEFQSQ